MANIGSRTSRWLWPVINALAIAAASCDGEAPLRTSHPPRASASPPTASSSIDGSPARALDGDPTTRWTSGGRQSPGHWFQVDLPAPQVVAQVIMDSGGSPGQYARAFEVFAFDDPAGADLVVPVASGTGAGAIVSVSFEPRVARHVRIALTGSAEEAWSIHEVAIRGASSVEECVAAIQPSPTLTGSAREVRYQEDILALCTGAGLASCERTLRARMNVDFFMAAALLTTERISTGTYIAVLRDREAKLRTFRKDPTLACEVATHDGDGDYVPDRADACPSTPPLTPVLADGCTNTKVPPGPDLQAVNKHLANVAVIFDPRCADNAPPATPTPLGVFRLSRDPSLGKAIWISRDPGVAGCPLFYEVEFQLEEGTLRSTIFKATEDVALPWTTRPERAVQFNVHTSDGGDRGAWAEHGSYTKEFRARAFNLAGQRSAWSTFVRPEYAECSAGNPTGDGFQ